MHWSKLFCCYEHDSNMKTMNVDELIISFDLTYLTNKPYCSVWSCHDLLKISNENEFDFALLRINELYKETSILKEKYHDPLNPLYLIGSVHVYGRLNEVRYELHTRLISQLIEILENAKAKFTRQHLLKI